MRNQIRGRGLSLFVIGGTLVGTLTTPPPIAGQRLRAPRPRQGQGERRLRADVHDRVVIPAVADTWIEDDGAGPHGDRKRLKVDGAPQRRSLLRFDLPAPLGADVARASLRLYALTDTKYGGRVDLLGKWCTTWDEATTSLAAAPPCVGRMSPKMRVGEFSGPVAAYAWQEATLALPPTALGRRKIVLRVSSTFANGVTYASRQNETAVPELVLHYGAAAAPAQAAVEEAEEDEDEDEDEDDENEEKEEEKNEEEEEEELEKELYKEYDAVIVGAGWAGLRAAATLLRKGIRDILVLEAADRVGGRCLSFNADGTRNDPGIAETTVPYDLGAEFSYDAGINAQQDELWEEGIIPGRVWEDPNYGSFAVWPTWPGKATYFRQERKGNGIVVTEKIEDGMGKGFDGDDMLKYVWQTFVRYRRNNLERLAGKSYGEAIEEYIQEDGWTDDEALQFLHLIEDAKHIEYGTSGHDMDITEIEFEDASFHVQTTYMGVPGVGWGNVAAKYAQGFASKIQTRARVTEINSEKDKDYAVVKYTDRGGSTRAVRAQTVLVTVSVGVLKAGSIGFAPPLPRKKQASIDAMGFGVINKCIMSWNDPAALVWPIDDLWFLLATPEKETAGKWTTFSNPSRFKGVPSLTAWIGGEDAIAAENDSDEKILRDVMKHLRVMFPTIRTPDNVIVTRWGGDLNVRGAYSFPAPGQAYYDDQEEIGRRHGRIHFAGEATSANGWATTFGAWDSGEEAAKDMVARLNRS